MFWDNFVKLCNQKNMKPNNVAKELGIPSGSVTDWKNGRVPRSTTLQKIADYFNVSTNDLLGKSDQKENKPSAESEELIQRLLNGDSNKMQILMSGGDGLKIIEIPEESKETVIRMLEALDKKNHD